MIFDLIRLKNGIEEYITIEKEYSFSKEQLEGTELLSLDNVKINGYITMDSIGQYTLSLDVEGIMVLPCSVTLKPVDVPFLIHIEGNLEELLEEIEENHKKIENSIDILPIIWENILMEIPMKVTCSDLSGIPTEGEGWKFVTNDGNVEINPELEKLKDLL